MTSISALINDISHNFMYSPSSNIHLIFYQAALMFPPWPKRILALEPTNLILLFHFSPSLWLTYPCLKSDAVPCDTCFSKFLWSLLFHNSLTSKSLISAQSCHQHLPNLPLFAHKHTYLHHFLQCFTTSTLPQRSIKSWKFLYYWPEHRISAFFKVLSLMKALQGLSKHQ